MSTIVQTEAVVLRGMKYRETSKIVTFYTKELGRVSGLVKGARRTNNKYGASLEPMSYVAIVLYQKEGRELQTIASCELMKSFRHLSEDITRMSVGMSLIELVFNVAHEQEGNVPLFKLLVKSLDELNRISDNPRNILAYFELHLAIVLGFHPDFAKCISCGNTMETSDLRLDDEYRFHITRGGILCSDCTNLPGQKVTVSGATVRILRSIQRIQSLEELSDLKVNEKIREEMEGLLWTYLRFHVSGMRNLKSTQVFSKILA